MRRLVMLLCALLAGTTVALVPTAAHAVVVHDGGTLTAEVTTTVTVGASDMTTYRLLVPAGAHPTISVTAIDADFTVDAAVTYDNDPTAGSIGDSGRGRVPSDHFIRLKGFPTAVADQPATLTFFCSSCSLSPPPRAVSFILHYPVDIERTVTSSQLLPITTSTPGQRIRLTVEGDYFQFWLFLRNLSLKSAHLGLADAEPFVLLDGFEMLKNGPGQWVAGENSGTRHTIEIVPSVDAIGTLDARVNAASFREQPTEYSAPDSAFLPVTAPADAAVFVNAKSGAPTLIHVQRADLLHSDGTPGSMTVPLLLPGEPARTLGTISSTPVTFSTGSSLEADAGVVIRLVNDGDSSGQVELRVRLDPGPSVPLALDTATTITAPDGATSVRYSLEATPESNYEISFGPATYGGAATTSSPVIIESEFGQPFGSGTLSDSAGASLILATPFSARFDIVLTVPPGGLTVDVLAVKATETAITATMPFESDLTITRGAENITVTLPVTSGRNLVVDVTDVSLSGAPDPTSEADITLLTLIRE